jgi:hypothetical protein
MDENWATSSLSSSSAPDGNRTLWDLVWKSDVPPKVQHFAWRLAKNSLPTWCNKKRRNIEISDQCPLCGMEAEDNFHPFLRCPLAKDLWIVMSEVWQLPDIVSIQNTGTEWLLNLLSNIPRRSINMVLMTLWRSWHVRNEIVHDKVPPPAEVSKRFLVGYLDSLIQIKYYYGEDLSKGKFILNPDMDNKNEKKKQQQDQNLKWSLPERGWCKVNTDGSFGANGDAGCGVVVRDHDGTIVLSACKQLLSCRDALEAEVFAMLEGLSLALHWCNQPLVIEADCLELINLLKKEELDRSVYSTTIEEIKYLLKIRPTCVTHVSRIQNTSSHFMANYARTSNHTAVWLSSGPEGLADICDTDCNLIL